MRVKLLKLKIIASVLLVQILAVSLVSMIDLSPASAPEDQVPMAEVAKRSFPIEVNCIGELEAASSISVSSNIRLEQAKVIELIDDGRQVNPGDVLVRIDPSPFEIKIAELQAQFQEQEAKVATFEHAFNWERELAEHEAKALDLEIESAQLELNKITFGDGPMEIAKLKAALQKAKSKYDELNSYSADLQTLIDIGALNEYELEQTKKKLLDEQEIYDNAKMQYESYLTYVHPMLVKKAETALKKLLNKKEEAQRSGLYNIEKAKLALNQAKQQHQDILRQLNEAQGELAQTEITAPTTGMVVLREEFRSNQRRKPRVGDILVRNQTILDLPDLTHLLVKSKVREMDLHKIDMNLPVTIEVDAYPQQKFSGRIAFVGILAITDLLRPTDEKHFEIKISIDEKNIRPRPGMTARAIIHAGQVEDRLCVPVHAIFEADKTLYCYVAKDKRYFKVPVQIGKSNEEWTEIVAGLEEGDKVCLVIPPEKTILPATFMAKSE